MKHLSEATLRRRLDDPASLAAGDRAHLRACRRCKDLAAQVVGDARRAAELLEGTPLAPVDPAAVLKALRKRGAVG
ncbi:MAG: hypothetical protein WD602_06760 [Actinomycetota bacterium]